MKSSTNASAAAPKGIKVKRQIKAGGVRLQNHNETLAHATKAKGVRVKTRVRAGGWTANHNETLVG